MSRDIRSFFQSKKVKVEEDDDIIPDSPDVQIKIKKKESKKKRVINDDSDEEIFTSKKKKTNGENLNQNNKSSAKPALKEVKATDIFGSGPIKRTEPIVKKVKEKKVTETGIHSDDDFDKSLLELDAVEDEVLKSAEKSSTSKDVDEIPAGNKKAEIKKDISPVKLKDTKNEDHSKKYNKVEHKKEKDKQSPGKPKNGRKEHKSKLDSKVNNDNKRKFSDFLEDETKHSEKSDEEKTIKKKKLNESATENKSNNTKNEADEEFNDSDATILDDSVLDESMLGKKKKLNKSLNETILTDEERHERRIQSAALYKSYLNRSGPKHLGSKEIPEGAPDCLKDCAFLLTGVLDSFEREEVADAIAKYGGTIKNSISKKVTHLLAGEEAGPAKMAKAQDLGIKIIGEDDFIQMIKDSSNKKTKEKEVKKDQSEIKKDKSEIKKEKSPNSKLGKIKAVPKEINSKTKNKSNDTVRNNESNENVRDERINGHNSKDKKIQSPSKAEAVVKSENKAKVKKEPVPKMKTEPETKVLKVSGSELKMDSKMTKADLIVNGSSSKSDAPLSLMWVDKYKPQNVKQIIGQHGDASNVKKLSNWLTKWYVNRKVKLPKPSPWAKNDDGGYYKAALLSGPPGVGKTTTVALVCKELGFDMVEFNASDTRSKNLIKQQIGELLTTTSLSGYANGDTGKQAVTKKHVLVMDEVDGMAGNEDRGGMQELIGLIKSSSVPIVCMCNDRNSQKMRSLVNYCYDLRFSRPRVDQIKSAMMSICFKEGLKIPPDVITQLITAANQDVRQTLHLLSMWAAEPNADKMRKDATSVRKDIKLGPWEAIRKVFSAEDHKSMSIHDKSDLFFYDYSLAPLFVFENYLQVAPHCPKKEVLDRLSKAADSISAGDLVDARIRRSQAWGLLPTQAMYSSVIPGHFLSGHVAGQIQFPGWLGKNSRAGKMRRLCQEIHAHTRLSTTGSKSSIFLDYSTHLRDAIVNPLIKDKSDGVPAALEALEAYHLLREDLDALGELALWPGQRDPMALVDSKVKAAMTRSYNKSAAALPYAPGTVRRGRARDAADADADADDADDGELDDQNDSDSDPENDALIKKKKTNNKLSASKDKASSSKEKATTSKDKSSSNKGKKKK